MSTRILVIEDNATNLDVMTYLLRSFGYAALTAQDGQTGLNVARHEHPDLIVCDVEIPVLDGLAVAGELKRDGALREVPLLAVTAYAMVGDRDRMLAAGFDGYIAKPIAPETFIAQIEAFLPPAMRSPGPMAQPQNPVTIQETTPQNSIERGVILVVDDVWSNANLLRSLLEPFGYSVLVARSLSDGLEMTRTRTPDLVVCDVHVGGSSGFDLLKLIKADTSLQHIPVALISATDRPREWRDLSQTAGAAAFLSWDKDAAALLADIEACVSAGSRARD